MCMCNFQPPADRRLASFLAPSTEYHWINDSKARFKSALRQASKGPNNAITSAVIGCGLKLAEELRRKYPNQFLSPMLGSSPLPLRRTGKGINPVY